VVGSAGPAAAAPGDLDPTFGTGGRVSTDYGGDFEEGRGMARQNDGRIVVAGESLNPDPSQPTGRDFAVVRYLTDGSLDPSFGGDGKVSTHLGRSFEIAFDMALQPDGKVVAAGTAGQAASITEPVFDFALARYNRDGSLDTSFGNQGTVITAVTGESDQIISVALQPDGRIVVAGFAGVGDFAVARYTRNGALDPSFGGDGIVTTDFPGVAGRANVVFVRADGTILVGGTLGDPADFALAAYRPDGSLYPSFGTGGPASWRPAAAMSSATPPATSRWPATWRTARWTPRSTTTGR
jgi:uncharacterized delta-60 repeat protein